LLRPRQNHPLFSLRHRSRLSKKARIIAASTRPVNHCPRAMRSSARDAPDCAAPSGCRDPARFLGSGSSVRLQCAGTACNDRAPPGSSRCIEQSSAQWFLGLRSRRP
jgi:hypothetical protein